MPPSTSSASGCRRHGPTTACWGRRAATSRARAASAGSSTRSTARSTSSSASPQWAVSIAAEDADGTVVGVVYDAERDELFSAERGGTATLDGHPLKPSTKSDMATALIGTGFGYDSEVRRAQAEVVARLLPDVRDIRRFGAAAIDLAWTACGRLDAYYEHGLNPWDLAAGGLICECVGLEIRALERVGPSQPGIVVGPPTLVDALAPRLV